MHASVQRVQIKTELTIVKLLRHALLIKSEMRIQINVFALLVLNSMETNAHLSVYALKVALYAMKKTKFVRSVRLALILFQINALFVVMVVLHVQIKPEIVLFVLLVTHLILKALPANKTRVLM